MKIIPHFLVAGAMVIGTACSSTNSATDAASTGGSSIGPGSGASGASASGTGIVGGAGSADIGATSVVSGAGGSMGATETGGSSGAGGTDMSGATGGTAAGAAGAADMTAFMGTFATMQDPVFLLNAASSNLMEIRAGQMAAQKASNADVRKFAEMMVSHHMKATQELKAVATPLGVKLTQTMMPVHQAMADRLMNKTGKGFDEAYMDLMETAHKMDIAMFEVKSKGAEIPAVKDFATRALPMLRSHQTMADTIEKKVD
ncbi:DUF4142 domain-containing protein [Hymenobacter terrenus]|uniref:DUF4142 domain-containing protein n=1 Tax=Hymenobacter terrenus TaxID=1629124 RepID=UPI00069843FE|nr:DUF4142 domain-containing protein [Hymenobacter terrenus]